MRPAFAGIIKKKYDGDPAPAAKDAAIKLARILQIKNYRDARIYYVLQNRTVFYCVSKKNWCKTRR
jgi:hypothetical protein